MAAVIAASFGRGEARPAKKPVRAPAITAPRPFNWTGCYIGGNVGYGWGSKEFGDTANGFLVGGALTDNIGGFLGGGQWGCNYQFSNNWVIGVEGSISSAGIRGNATSPVPIAGAATTFQATTNWIGSATGRLGFSWNRWLPYVKGGAAWAGDRYTALNASSYVGNYSASETRSGWTIGVGLEWAFANDWSAKLEYEYYDFGSRDLNFINPAPSGFPPFGPISTENVRQQIQTVTIGVNYRLWTGGAPVAWITP